MERLEGHLSLRERRVARLERALREADAKLTAERNRLIAEREAIEKELPQKLREREQQLEIAGRNQQELERRLAAHLARERETLIRTEQLTAERDQAAGELEKARQELQEARRRQTELESQLEDLERRRDEWERPASAAGAAVADDTSASALEGSDEPAFRRSGMSPARRAAAVILPVACFVIGAATYRYYPRTWEVEGVLMAPSDWSSALAWFENRPDDGAKPALDQIVTRRQDFTPALVTSMLVRDRNAGIARVNAEMQVILRQLPTLAAQPASRPADRGRRERLETDLREIDAQMAALTARLSEGAAKQSSEAGGRPAPPGPAPASADPVKLLAGWRKTLAEREAVDIAAAEVDAKLQRKPPEAAQVQVSAQQLAAAFAADARLQADSEVLKQRESRLAEGLREVLDNARQAFTDMADTAAASDKHLAELLATPQDPDVREALNVIRNSLSSCAKAAAALARDWRDERAAVDAGGGRDGMAARYAAAETAARQFVESTDNSLALLRESLNAISQGGTEPTKRLVLRSALAQKLQPALDARENLVSLVKQVSAGENVELASFARGAAALHAQVLERRSRIEQALRGQVLDQMRADYEQEMRQLRARREELARKASEMDAAVVRAAGEALSLLGGSQAREAALAEMVQLTRLRPEIVAELAALDQADARAAAAAARLGELRYAGAVARDVTSMTRIWAAVAAGAGPIVLLGIVALFAWAIRAGRSRRSLDDYAKALRDLPPRNPAGPANGHRP